MVRFLLIVLAILTSSCASTTHIQQYPGLDSDGATSATLYFVRDKSFYGSAIGASVSVDSYQVGSIGPGGSLKVRVPAKKVSITTTSGSFDLSAEASSEYYFEVFLPFHGVIAMDEFEISAISKERAKALGIN